MTALEAVTPGAGTGSGSARIVVVRAVPGEEFDGPAEEVAGRAPERDATNPMAGVVRALAGRELLMIVLDNCEHVLGSVSRHLSHIFAKLGITTRAELAAQAAAQDLTAR